jgi:hypothetical protein
LPENHINGENLMEMDQTHLRDMGIKKVGDRVRIGSQAKQLRNKEYKKASRRVSNRVSTFLRLWTDSSNSLPAIPGNPGQCLIYTTIWLAKAYALGTACSSELPDREAHVSTDHKLGDELCVWQQVSFPSQLPSGGPRKP